MRATLSMSFLMFAVTVSMAQPSNFSFQKLGLPQGLHDGTVRAIGEDRYGYIWIATAGALNRFDGKNVRHFTHIPGDTTSPYATQPRSIQSDKAGRLWLGFENGLMEFDFATEKFKPVPVLHNYFIADIQAYNDSLLLLATRRGLISYNTRSQQAFFYAQSEVSHHRFLKSSVNRMRCKKNLVYLATSNGLVVFNPLTDEVKSLQIPQLGNQMILSADADDQGRIWFGSSDGVKLGRIESDLKTLEIYNLQTAADDLQEYMNIRDLIVDRNQVVWAVTAVDGLLQYDQASNSFFKHLNNPNIPSSPSSNFYRAIFRDDRNIIWLGGDYFGVDYFEPNKFSFQTILPFPDRLNEKSRGVGRAVTEDKDGNIWMGTHDGVSKLNITTHQYSTWQNENGKPPVLYHNGIRSMECDNDNNIWIGTANGVNRYVSKTGKMEFIPYKELPPGFYNSINKDREGNIWFGGNLGGDMLYWYDAVTKKIHGISEHPQLSAYKRLTPVSYVFEDDQQRLWISFSRKGMIMLDKKTKEIRELIADETKDSGLIGNQVVDIKQDKKGLIWASTFNGVSAYHPASNTYLNYSIQNGLPGNRVSSLAIDDDNRVWLGVGGGLTMIDADRQQIIRFTEEDGLPSSGFPEHAGIKTANGDIIFPTYRGFIRFNPSAYKRSDKKLNFYLANYSVFGKQFMSPPISGKQQIQLEADDNSITFNLIALNYSQPLQTWYAYQLKGFDEKWHYSQDPKAVYTNLPGGNYQFLYKASTHNSDWDTIAAKTMTLQLASHFYETLWFWLLMFLLVAGGFFALYRYRTHQQQQLFHLKSVTQLLEKEKATVMYESLKQHLNPHFLFNSLTSLRSLIKTDSATAAKFLDGLSKVYRYILKSGGQDLVLLHDELEFVTTFTELQKVRFGEGFIVKTNVSADAQQKHIAPVVLQNLVENAIKHNTTSTESPLVIEIVDVDNNLLVRNNLQRYKSVETSNKRGLASLKNLYGFFTDEPIMIEEDDEYFTVKIPLL